MAKYNVSLCLKNHTVNDHDSKKYFRSFMSFCFHARYLIYNVVVKVISYSFLLCFTKITFLIIFSVLNYSSFLKWPVKKGLFPTGLKGMVRPENFYPPLERAQKNMYLSHFYQDCKWVKFSIMCVT